MTPSAERNSYLTFDGVLSAQGQVLGVAIHGKRCQRHPPLPFPKGLGLGRGMRKEVRIEHGYVHNFFMDGYAYCYTGHPVIDLTDPKFKLVLKDGVCLVVSEGTRLLGVACQLDLGWVKLEGAKDWEGQALPVLKEIALEGKGVWLWVPQTQRWLFVVSEETWKGQWKKVKKYLLSLAPERGIIGLTLTLGGDPEFEPYVGGQFVPAVEVPIFKEGGFRGAIGLDEFKEIAELRPAPAYSEEEYVKNFLTLVKRVRQEGILLSVKGDILPLGGHIHIGSPNKKVAELLRKEEEAFVQVLDDFVGRVLRPTSGKARTGWNVLGFSVWKEYGLEYCTPPSSFYADLEMVRTVYKLVRNLVEFLLIEEEFSYEVLEDGRAKPEEYYRFLTPQETEYFLGFPERWARGEVSPFVPMKPVVLMAAG